MSPPSRYHHGDLRPALLDAGATLLKQDGIDGLSLRKLAERVGVSRSAPYHHFKDKQQLLCALAAQGFTTLDTLVAQAHLDGDKLETGLRDFIQSYLDFATDNPEQYELMFGRTIWKYGNATKELKQVAFQCFRHYADRISALYAHDPLPNNIKPLRLTQASWAMLHGLCRLLIDGIYINRKDMEEVSDAVIKLTLAALKKHHKLAP